MSQNRKHLLSIAEFAQYEGVSKETVKRWIKNGSLPTIKVKGNKGHRKNHFENRIHYTNLTTKEAQEAFLKDRNLLPAEEKPSRNDDELSHLKPWQREALERKEAVVKEFLKACEGLPKGKLGAFRKQFAQLHGISEPTLKRDVKKFSKGGRHALIPGWNPGSQEKLIDKEMADFIKNEYLKPFGPPIKEVYELLSNEFREKRESIPTYCTVVRHINSRWSKEQQLLLRDTEQWSRLYSPHVRRDWSKAKINEVWVGDAKQIDVACLFRGKPVFPWWTSFIDARSRKFVGWILTPVHDSWAIAQAFVYAVSKHGTPETIYIDRGKSYKSHLIAGTKLKQGKVVSLFGDIDDTAIPGIFRDLGCEIYYAAPYNAREKLIEPAFKVFTKRLRHLPGYRGHSVKTRPKKLENEIKTGKLLSFEELSKEIEKVVNERNDRPHSTTSKAPNSFYENYTPVIPSQDVLGYLLMDVNITKVKDSLVTVKGMNYRQDELWRLAGQTVEVRRDPNDLSQAGIIYRGKVFCFAHLETPDHYRSPKTLEAVKTTNRIRRKINRFRKAVYEHQGAIDDPLTFAADLEVKENLRAREIRPASSKLRSLHSKEKLAKDIAQGFKNQEVEEDEWEAVSSGDSMLTRSTRATRKVRKEEEKNRPRFRLVERLSMYDEDDDIF